MNPNHIIEKPVKITRSQFLKDVFICSLAAYGGPEAHYGVFSDQLVNKKHYLTDDELIELVALCSILPGPTSTQTIVSIGYKTGGPLLALLTMIVWALPVLILMTALSFLYGFLNHINFSTSVLRFIGPMAVGFIVIAAKRIFSKVVTDGFTFSLAIASAAITYFIRSPWIFPLVLIIGGVLSTALSGEKDLWNRISLSPPWRFLWAFIGFALGGILLNQLFENRILELFEMFYRYGYLVFGGGQVVIPVMYSELVELHQSLSNGEFLTGYGLVQGLPGPMFSFSAYAGGMAARGGSTLTQILGAVVSGIGIFLPGLLLIYFVYPVWEQLKKLKGVKISLKGINAVAGGLISVSALILMQKSGFTPINIIVTLITVMFLSSKKISAPFIVLMVLILGFII